MQKALKSRTGTANTTGATGGYEAQLWRRTLGLGDFRAEG